MERRTNRKMEKEDKKRFLEMPEVRVALYGVGVMGGNIAKLLIKKKGIKIVGAVDVAAGKVGKDLGEAIGAGKSLGITIRDDPDRLFSEVEADVAIHATSSFLRDAYPQIVTLAKHGVNVVSTCEELSYPYVSEPDLAKKLDKLAKEHDVTILGTGINPGFLMDTLAITLTGVCQQVESIRIARVMNAANRRVPFQKKIGAGLTVGEFKERMAQKIITGHVGLQQSIAMIADALGWTLQKIEVGAAEPVVAKKHAESEAIKVEAGQVSGLKQTAQGIMGGKPVITLVFEAYIGAEEEYDSITVEGTPRIHEKITPCTHGDLATTAIIVNSIPKVINAAAGLKTMKDLPVPSATVSDMRLYIKR
jgi:4-hydroxy-tetrahydrodipicolinate reductase